MFSFYGCAIDLDAIGKVCHERDAIFVVNGSQAIGARDIDLSRTPIDALVSCGFKWLCGPYATGFTWIRPEVPSTLRYEQAYWLAHASPGAPTYKLQDDIDAACYDVFWDGELPQLHDVNGLD